MRFEHRMMWEEAREWIRSFSCGCAFILRTGEQVSFCPTCPRQQSLPLEKI